MSTSKFQKIAITAGAVLVSAAGVLGAGAPAMASVSAPAPTTSTVAAAEHLLPAQLTNPGAIKKLEASVKAPVSAQNYNINAGGGTQTVTFTPAPGFSGETPFTYTQDFKIVEGGTLTNGVFTVDTNLGGANEGILSTPFAAATGNEAQYTFSTIGEVAPTTGTLTETHDLNYGGTLTYTVATPAGTMTIQYNFTLLQMQPIIPNTVK